MNVCRGIFFTAGISSALKLMLMPFFCAFLMLKILGMEFTIASKTLVIMLSAPHSHGQLCSGGTDAGGRSSRRQYDSIIHTFVDTQLLFLVVHTGGINYNGRRIVNSVPFPSVLLNSIVPLCLFTIKSYTTARPFPVTRPISLVVYPLSNILLRFFFLIPIPVSVIFYFIKNHWHTCLQA